VAATVNIIPTAPTDGILYANNVPLVATEASLGDGLKTPDPIPVVEGQTIVAVVKLSINGHVTANNTYIFLQTDLGDGTWIDVAWCQFTKTDVPSSQPATFVLCGGGLGAMNNAFQQSRQAGSAPAAQGNGSNAVPLGGRVRFSGFSTFAGGSSSIAGVTTSVSATITYRLQNPR
jgi:hypothetical protein